MSEPRESDLDRQQARSLVAGWVAAGMTCMPASKDDLQMMRTAIATTLSTNREIAVATLERRSAELEADRMRVREQLASIVSSVLAGCTGVTIASNGEHAPPPRGSKIVHRCSLEKRLQEALHDAATQPPPDPEKLG